LIGNLTNLTLFWESGKSLTAECLTHLVSGVAGQGRQSKE
jgi:hypothetical protein